METFNFPNFLLSEEHPESSNRVQFGKGWQFASKPDAPDQLSFVLTFPGMRLYPNAAGTGLNLTTNPTFNLGTLIAFYERHRLYEKFIFPHPWRGSLVCRFKDPLVVPKGIPNAKGLVEPFELRFILQP